MNKKAQQPNTCVIYCRVSSKKQAQQGDSLEKQAKKCAIEAKRRGLKVVHRPFEEPFTGRADSRPVFDEMLEYLIINKGKIGYLLFLEIGRASRGGDEGYTGFDRAIRGLGVQIIDAYGIIQPEKNLLEEYGDIADYDWAKRRPSKSSEIMYAEMKKQEVDDMLVRLIGRQIDLTQAGYWIGHYPFGFRTHTERDSMGSGKKRTILVPDEKEAKHIKEMYRLRVEGIFSDKEIVKKINEDGYRSRVRKKWDKLGMNVIGKTGGNKLTEKKLDTYMKTPIYAGIMRKKWTHQIPIKAQFEGLISLEDWNLANKGKVYIEKLSDDEYKWLENLDTKKRVKTKVSPLYPYKHVIKCPKCQNNFWASAPKGKSKKGFPMYHCSGNRNGKPKHPQFSVPASEFNDVIEQYVRGISFDKDSRNAFEAIFKDAYQRKHKNQISVSQQKAQEVKEMKTRLQHLYEKHERAMSEVVERKLEKQIEELDEKIKQAETDRNQSEAIEHDFVTYLKIAKHLLEHPAEILLKPRKKEDQQAIWSLVFEELPTYDDITTGTPKLSLCFNTKGTLSDASGGVVGDEGFEPPTFAV